MSNDDFALALALQSEEYNESNSISTISSSSSSSSSSKNTSSSSSNITSSRWKGPLNTVEAELLDPTPDIRALFRDFNDRFFQSKLSCCEVKWSKKMTLCAGICSFDGGLCSIRLSEPLLSLRPRSDLVNTLCHEMIHGYDFLVTGERSRDGHGPSFLKKAKEINDAAGTQITIYHSFNNEVAVYRTHVWKCNGICATKPPFFGLVKRANNRPPQKADTWFEQHQKECGGSFIKISEPSKSTSKSTTKSIDSGKLVSKKRIRDSKTLDSFWKKATTSTTTTTITEKGSVQTSKVEVINLEEDDEEEKKEKKREDDDDDDDEVEVVVLEEEEELIALDLDDVDVDDDDDDDSVVIISIE